MNEELIPDVEPTEPDEPETPDPPLEEKGDSILTSIKKLLGIDEEYEHFDKDIVIHINSAFMILTQLGVGPKEGFKIHSKEETWEQYEGIDDLQGVIDYVYMKTRIIFDPPANSFTVASLEREIKEMEWRLNVKAEEGDANAGKKRTSPLWRSRNEVGS